MMHDIDYRAMIYLKACRDRLTVQQYKTLRGQVLAGDSEAAMKGLRTILLRQGKAVSECQKSATP